MKVNSKRMKALALAMGVIIVGLVLSLTPTTWSFLTSSDTITNPFALGTVDIEVDEDFLPPEAWDGESASKVVRVQNLGTEQSLIRVAIIPRWENTDGTPFAGDISLLSLTFENIGATPGWLTGSDGYFYYTAKVASGMSTKPVMSTVKFLPGIPSEILARYNGKNLIIDVKAEAVLASEEAYEAVWSQIASSSDPVNTMLRNLIVTP